MKSKKTVFADLKIYAPDKNEIKSLLKMLILKNLSYSEDVNVNQK